MRLSSKQVEIMQKIQGKNPDGTLLDITQLRNSLSYTATKQAILCSVNYLVQRGLVERVARENRGGRLYTTIALTALGSAHLASYVPNLKSVLLEPEGSEI